MTGPKTGGARPGASGRIDWRRAAALLAEGMPLAEVAATVGCTATYLTRKRRDPEFRRWVAESRPAPAEPAPGDPLVRLRAILHDAIEQEVKNGNARIILWLADRLKLLPPPDQAVPEDELHRVLGGLSQDELREFEALRDVGDR